MCGTFPEFEIFLHLWSFKMGSGSESGLKLCTMATLTWRCRCLPWSRAWCWGWWWWWGERAPGPRRGRRPPGPGTAGAGRCARRLCRPATATPSGPWPGLPTWDQHSVREERRVAGIKNSILFRLFDFSTAFVQLFLVIPFTDIIHIRHRSKENKKIQPLFVFWIPSGQ